MVRARHKNYHQMSTSIRVKNWALIYLHMKFFTAMNNWPLPAPGTNLIEGWEKRIHTIWLCLADKTIKKSKDCNSIKVRIAARGEDWWLAVDPGMLLNAGNIIFLVLGGSTTGVCIEINQGLTNPTYGPNPICCLFLYIKFYWNTTPH